MSGPRGCRVVGRWRIVEADLWDTDYLDLVQPAMPIIGSGGHGEIAFGAFQAGLDISYGTTTAFFTWSGFDEMDEVTGDGSVERLDDGTLEIEFNRHLGDEAILKAVPAPSSTAC